MSGPLQDLETLAAPMARIVEKARISVTLYHLRKLVLMACPATLVVFQLLEERLLEEGKLRGTIPVGYCWHVKLDRAASAPSPAAPWNGNAISGSGWSKAMELILSGGRRAWSGEWELLQDGTVLIRGAGQPVELVNAELVDDGRRP